MNGATQNDAAAAAATSATSNFASGTLFGVTSSSPSSRAILKTVGFE